MNFIFFTYCLSHISLIYQSCNMFCNVWQQLYLPCIIFIKQDWLFAIIFILEQSDKYTIINKEVTLYKAYSLLKLEWKHVYSIN